MLKARGVFRQGRDKCDKSRYVSGANRPCAEVITRFVRFVTILWDWRIFCGKALEGKEKGRGVGSGLFCCRNNVGAYTRSGGVASLASASATSASGSTLECFSPRRRIDTVPSSTSFMPQAKMTGTLPTECSRTL